MDYILSSSKEGSKKEKGGRDTPISSEKKPRTRGQEKEKELANVITCIESLSNT
jgi:hypothetical protein